jgi:hypothetical protein
MSLTSPASGARRIDIVLLLFLFGLFLFLSPFTSWWAAVAAVWYLPFLLWFGFIALIAWVAHLRHDDV